MPTRKCLSLLLGISVGASIALLAAPRSGKKTRRRILEAATDSMESVRECGEMARDTARQLVDRGREEIERRKEGVANAIRRGAEAYQESAG